MLQCGCGLSRKSFDALGHENGAGSSCGREAGSTSVSNIWRTSDLVRLSASPKQSQKHLEPSLPSSLLAAGAQGDVPAATPLERSNGAVVADGVRHAPARRRIRMMPRSFRPVVCTCEHLLFFNPRLGTVRTRECSCKVSFGARRQQ